MEKVLEKIFSDSVSGSADILRKLSRYLLKHSGDKKKLVKLVRLSRENLSSFGTALNYLRSIEKQISNNDPAALREAIERPLKDKNVYLRIFNNAFPHIEKIDTVFTLSNSRTVLEVLKLLFRKNRKLAVYITESRPRNEGRIMAGKLLSEGIKVTFGTDAAMAQFIDSCGAVFCGADKILKDGSIINKTGSYQAAVLCEKSGKPFYIFTESSKSASFCREKEKNPGEVWKHRERGLTVKNLCFEIVPPELITKIFTE